MPVVKTEGSTALAALARSRGPATLARALGCAASTVSNWSAARRSPDDDARRDIARLFDVPIAAWDRAVGAAGATSPQNAPARPSRVRRPKRQANALLGPAEGQEAPATAKPGPDAPLAPLDLRDEAEAAVRRAKADIARLDADATVSPRERATATATLTGALRVLARIADGADVTEEQIVKSKAWRSLLGRLEPALRPFPDAARAMARVLGGAS